MIKVNLLPVEFRVKTRQTQKIPAVQIGIGIGALLTILTIYFYIDFLVASSELKGLNRRWKEVEPQSQLLSKLQKEVEGTLKQEKDFMEHFVTTQRPLTSILMEISQSLPETAWLIEIKMERDPIGSNLQVKGLALPSKQKTSIEQIEEYLHKLKQTMPEMNLSLTTSRETKEGIELTQFVATFEEGKKKVK